MQLSDAFLALGEEGFVQLLRHVSIGKLRTYQLYDTFRVRAHVPKLNTEVLRKTAPRFWARVNERDEEFVKDLAQAILVCHLDMITAVLDLLGVPNQAGFFSKDLDAKKCFSEGWQERVYKEFRGAYPEPAVLFYINHLGWELAGATEVFSPPKG